MRKHVLEEPPPLSPAALQAVGQALGDAVGPRFEAVIKKLLKKSASERYASASELVQALSEVTDEVTALSSTPESTLRSPATVVVVSSGMSSPEVVLAKTRVDSGEMRLSERKSRRGPILLGMVAIAGALLYWLGISPSGLLQAALAGHAPSVEPIPTALLTAATSVASATTPEVELPSADLTGDMASAATADSASPADSDDNVAAPEDSATTAAPAPSHHGPHVTQGRPATKPIHKANKNSPPPAPKHGGLYIPPPGQWFKN
jgi:hypothetical protein